MRTEQDFFQKRSDNRISLQCERSRTHLMGLKVAMCKGSSTKQSLRM